MDIWVKVLISFLLGFNRDIVDGKVVILYGDCK